VGAGRMVRSGGCVYIKRSHGRFSGTRVPAQCVMVVCLFVLGMGARCPNESARYGFPSFSRVPA
jgi:hypothetical protein